jgi:hypothetical protein
MREKRAELAADPSLVEAVLSAGADKVRPILEATRREVLEAVGTGRPGGRTS